MHRRRQVALSCLALLLDFSAAAFAAGADRPDFEPHLVSDPNTVGTLKFDLETPMGAPSLQANSYFLDTLMVGIGERFEVGTMPLLYLFQGNGIADRNIAAKINFYRDAALSLSLGYRFNYLSVPDSEFLGPEVLDTNVSPAGPATSLYQNGVSLLGAVALAPKWSLGAGLELDLVSVHTGRSDVADTIASTEPRPMPA